MTVNELRHLLFEMPDDAHISLNVHGYIYDNNEVEVTLYRDRDEEGNTICQEVTIAMVRRFQTESTSSSIVTRTTESSRGD